MNPLAPADLQGLFVTFSIGQKQSTLKITMLKNIHIQNYRGIKDLKINDFKRINLLVGDNNSGKTSVLEAVITLTPSLLNFFDPILLRENMGVFVSTNPTQPLKHLVNLDKLEDQFYQKNVDCPIKIDAKFNQQKLSVRASLISDYTTFEQTLSNNVEARKLSEKNSFIMEYSLNGKKVEKLGLSNNGTGKILGTNSIMRPYFLSEITPGRKQLFDQFTPIVNTNRETEFVSMMRIFEPTLKNIKQSGGDDVKFDLGNGLLVSISYMGTGFIKFFSTVLTIYSLCSMDNEKSVVISIDEIGSGLHHSKLKHLWSTVFMLLDKYPNLQIIAATQSYDVIKALGETYRSRQDNDDLRLFKIKKSAEEISHALKYDAEMIIYAIEDETEVR